MRLVVTGGGTGGHVFPALEVARLALERGHEVLYFGSKRGLEGAAAKEIGIPFNGFPSQPVYSLRSVRGWKGLVQYVRSVVLAQRDLQFEKPQAVFSTGGYSGGPVVSAATKLHIPIVLHEQNTVPGRAISMFAPHAYRVTGAFQSAAKHMPTARFVRTGMPLRASLRQWAVRRPVSVHRRRILVVGGSQGAQAINEVVLEAANLVPGASWLHVAGKANEESVRAAARSQGLGQDYDVRGYLEAEEMGEAYAQASLTVGRSGSSVGELAAFRLPSVLIPYPSAAGNHQHHNAEEFERMGAATLIPQDRLGPELLAETIEAWLTDGERQKKAERVLAEFDAPDAAERILDLIEEAAESATPKR